MDALKAAGLCALLAAPPHAADHCGAVVHVSSTAIDRWQTLIEAASQRFGIPVAWIAAVMVRESAGRTTLGGHPITSPAGAMGLMQLMPSTWSDLRAQHHLGNDPFDPHDNIFAGTAYLRQMFDRYGYPNLFAAYHAGPGRLDAVLAGVKPLPAPTKTYLENLVPGAEIGSISTGNRLSMPSDSLFFVRAGDENTSVAGSNSLPNSADHSRAAPSLIVPLGTITPSRTR
ncbi:MAG TPA: lytic transglycosylase domain-containing protein [Devosia sp.]|nr:lytic transglycosylase domain-containing protein [Devosia sp.]